MSKHLVLVVPDRKTPAMRMVEQLTGLRIEEILMSGSLRQVGKVIGVSPSTVSKWIKRLGLRG